jgi:hypothetical protein
MGGQTLTNQTLSSNQTLISGQALSNQGLTVQSVPSMGGLGIASSFSDSSLTQSFSTVQTAMSPMTTFTTVMSPMTTFTTAMSPLTSSVTTTPLSVTGSSKKKPWKKKKGKDEQPPVIYFNSSCKFTVGI